MRIRLAQKIDLFLGKIQRRFNQHAQMNQRIPKLVYLAREFTNQRSARTARSRFSTGINQICDGLGLCQVHLVIQERAL